MICSIDFAKKAFNKFTNGNFISKARENNEQALSIAEITDNLHWVAIHNLEKNRKIAKRKIRAVEKYRKEFIKRDLSTFIELSESVSGYSCNRKRYIKEIKDIKKQSVIGDSKTPLSIWFQAPSLLELKLNELEEPFAISGVEIGDALNVRPFSLELVSEKNLNKSIKRYEKSKKSIHRLRVLNETMLDYQRNCLIAVKYYDKLMKKYRKNLAEFKAIIEKRVTSENCAYKKTFRDRFAGIFSDRKKCSYLKLSSDEQKVLDRLVMLTDLILESFRMPVVFDDGCVNVKLKKQLEKLAN